MLISLVAELNFLPLIPWWRWSMAMMTFGLNSINWSFKKEYLVPNPNEYLDSKPDPCSRHICLATSEGNDFASNPLDAEAPKATTGPILWSWSLKPGLSSQYEGNSEASRSGITTEKYTSTGIKIFIQIVLKFSLMVPSYPDELFHRFCDLKDLHRRKHVEFSCRRHRVRNELRFGIDHDNISHSGTCGIVDANFAVEFSVTLDTPFAGIRQRLRWY